MNAPGCIEPEVVAAYVDHGLSLAERARVEAHLASCPQCTALLAGVVRTVADVSAFLPDAGVTTEATPLVTRRAVLGGLAAAAAVIAVLVVPSLVRPWLERRDAGLVSLVDSVGEQRSVLGRLTGGFPHAPLDVSSAGGQDDQAAEADRVLLTAGRIRESFGEIRTPARLHELGLAQLLAGRYDDATQSLLAASREQPANPQYLSDVAAVQLERARLGLRPDDLPRAFAAADRARRLDPSLREAWFNRALSLSALGLTDQARTAWTEYLSLDGDSAWAREARVRLEELAKPTPAAAWVGIEARLVQSIDATSADAAMRAQMTEARQFLERELFVNWANAVLAGQDGGRALDRAKVMSEAMLRVAGDALYRDAIAAIERGSAADTRRIAGAFKKYSDLTALLVADRFNDAADGLKESYAELAGSPVRHLAALGLGTIYYVRGQYDAAETLLSQIDSAGAYPYARGRATWLRGMSAFAKGRLADAQGHYDDTLATFERMGDVELAGGAHNLLSGLAYQLGDKVSEWRHRRAAIDAMVVSRSPRFKHTTLATAAASARQDSPEAALAIQESVLFNASESGRDAAVIEALAQRASTLLSLGRATEATETIEEARQVLGRVSDRALHSIIELPVLAVESDLLRSSNAVLAAAAARQAIRTATERGDRSRLPQFQLRLAKASLALGRLADADAALTAGIAAFDETRAKPSGLVVVSAFDESWQLFETAVRLSIRRGDHERAFALAERGRVSSPEELQRIPTLAEVQRVTRPDEAIIALSQFEDELAVWLIRHNQTDVVMRPISRLDAERIVARQQDEIRLETDRVGAGATLFDQLVRPIASRLVGVERVVFVPDATYQNVSFPALWDNTQRRFAIETWTVSAAPNLSVVAAASARVPSQRRGSALVVAATADAGANQIASQYAGAQVALGANATRSRFMSLAPAAAVVHVAVPSYSNAAYPLLSRLMFNDEPGRRHSGTVLGREIADQPWPGTRLVVLDEVRTQPEYRTAGALNLARAFLAAGVPAVLGTLPGADGSQTRELIEGFHRQVAAQVPADEALTRVQRNALQQNGRRLGAWTALVIYGSDR